MIIGGDKLKIAQITPAEEKVMLVIWKYGEEEQLNLPLILKKVNDTYNLSWKSQTVSTFLTRLVRKRYLYGYHEGKFFYYRAILAHQDYIEGEMFKILSFWFEGDKDAMISLL